MSSATSHSFASRGTGWRVRTWDSIRERRRRKDSSGRYFFTPKDEGNNKWISVPAPFKNDAKRMIQGKVLKTCREAQSDSATHDLWQAFRSALRAGSINATEHKEDQRINRAANEGKHSTSGAQWQWAKSSLADSGASFTDDKNWPGLASSSVVGRKWPDAFDEDSFGDVAVSAMGFIGDYAANEMDGDLETSSDLEASMPTDKADLVRVALPELPARHNERSADLEKTCDLDRAHDQLLADYDGYGHLQTFYVPLAHEQKEHELREKIAILESNLTEHLRLCSVVHLERDQMAASIFSLNCQLRDKDERISVLLGQLCSFQGVSSHHLSCDRNLEPSIHGQHDMGRMHFGSTGWQLYDGFTHIVPLGALDTLEGSEKQFLRACDQFQDGPGSELLAFPSPPSLPCDQLQRSAGSEVTSNLVDDLRESFNRRIEESNSLLREHLRVFEQRLDRLSAALEDALQVKPFNQRLEDLACWVKQEASFVPSTVEEVAAKEEKLEIAKDASSDLMVGNRENATQDSGRRVREMQEASFVPSAVEDVVAKEEKLEIAQVDSSDLVVCNCDNATQDDGRNNQEDDAENSFRFADLLAKFQGLQGRSKKVLDGVSDKNEDVKQKLDGMSGIPKVDMGTYVSNSILSEDPFEDDEIDFGDDREFEAECDEIYERVSKHIARGCTSEDPEVRKYIQSALDERDSESDAASSYSWVEF